jgi:hypothetical protein
MKVLFLLPLLFLLGSCRFFDKQVPDEDALLQQRLKELDTTKVSMYPSVKECEVITDKNLRKDCFFSTMSQLIQQKLSADTIALMYPGVDTINVKVTIFADARLQFETQFPRDSLAYDHNKIDSIIKARLVGFPKVEPAQKEGVPVTSQFILPVVIDVEK